MIVENQNPRVFPCALAEEIGGCQSADPAADDYEVVALVGICRIAEGIRALAVAQAMGKGECSVVIAAHSLARRRIIVRRFFRGEFIEGGRRKQGFFSNPSSYKRSANADGHAIQKITPGDFAVHTQIFIFFLFAHPWPSSAIHSRRL